jgi:hypothetical protein
MWATRVGRIRDMTVVWVADVPKGGMLRLLECGVERNSLLSDPPIGGSGRVNEI